MQQHLMNILFAIASCIYIAGIFLLADVPTQAQLRTLNPYSLAHIPLYGILTLLLILTFPLKKISNPHPMTSDQLLNQRPSASSAPTICVPLIPNLPLMAPFMAITVGILDEIHQIWVPGRDASLTDVLMDAIGIGLALLFYIRWTPRTIQTTDQ